MCFCYFVIISQWYFRILFIWTNLNPSHLRMLCTMLKLAKWFLRRRRKREIFTDVWMTHKKRSEKFTVLELSAQLGELKTHFCLYHPSLEKKLTRHCCNSLQWWWQINCLCASFAASSVTGFLIWSISLHD